MNKEEFKNVDEYIKLFPKDIQAKLKKIRATIKKVVPDAIELIKYQMPTYFLNENLVHFAAFKNHIGFFPTPSGVENFKEELAEYKTSKGTIQFQNDQPIPYNLVKEITEFRLQEAMEKKQKKIQGNKK